MGKYIAGEQIAQTETRTMALKIGLRKESYNKGTLGGV